MSEPYNKYKCKLESIDKAYILVIKLYDNMLHLYEIR